MSATNTNRVSIAAWTENKNQIAQFNLWASWLNSHDSVFFKNKPKASFFAGGRCIVVDCYCWNQSQRPLCGMCAFENLFHIQKVLPLISNVETWGKLAMQWEVSILCLDRTDSVRFYKESHSFPLNVAKNRPMTFTVNMGINSSVKKKTVQPDDQCSLLFSSQKLQYCDHCHELSQTNVFWLKHCLGLSLIHYQTLTFLSWSTWPSIQIMKCDDRELWVWQ